MPLIDSLLLSLLCLLLDASKHPLATLTIQDIQDAIVSVFCLKRAKDLANECELFLQAESALQKRGVRLTEEERLSAEKRLLESTRFHRTALRETQVYLLLEQC